MLKRHKICARLLMCALLYILGSMPVRAVDASIVRVGLAYGSSAMTAPQLQNVDGTGYEIGVLRGTQFVSEMSVSNTKLTIKAQGKKLLVTDTSTGSILYQTDGTTLTISPKGTLTWFNQYKYRGDFVYTVSNGKIVVVNVVQMDEYLKGVIPYEMSASWPLEALKAQAVCARSYADGQRSRHQSQGFDVCNTTHCQVYRGANSATSNSDAAVDATSGQYLYADGKRVVGYFFSSDGGATESSVNVWGGEFAYLTGKPDPYEDTKNISNGVWSKTLTAAEIQAKLKAANYSIGPIQSVQITKRTAMNNVNELTITDVNGKQVKLTREACRTVLGLNSIRYAIGGQEIPAPSEPVDKTFYVIDGNGHVTKIDQLDGKTVITKDGKQTIQQPFDAQSVDRQVDQLVSGNEFLFSGTGWGHSVGMSQYGAKAMAEKGFTYDQILKFYYTGVTIET